MLFASVDAAPHVDVVLRGMGVVAAAGTAFADADYALEWAEIIWSGRCGPGEAPGGEYPFERLGCSRASRPGSASSSGAAHAARVRSRRDRVPRRRRRGRALHHLERQRSVKVTLAAREHERSGAKRRLVTFAAGTAFGEMALLDREARSATVHATSAWSATCSTAGLQRIERDLPAIAIKLLTNLGVKPFRPPAPINRMLRLAR